MDPFVIWFIIVLAGLLIGRARRAERERDEARAALKRERDFIEFTRRQR
jgi:hypothetical protein